MRLWKPSLTWEPRVHEHLGINLSEALHASKYDSTCTLSLVFLVNVGHVGPTYMEHLDFLLGYWI